MGDAVETEAGVVFVESAPSEPEADFDQDAPLNEYTPAVDDVLCEEKCDPTHKQYPVESNDDINTLIARMMSEPDHEIDASAPNAAFLRALDRRVRIVQLLQKDMSDMVVKIARIQRSPAVLTARDIYARRDALLERIGDLLVTRNDAPMDKHAAIHLALLERELAGTTGALADSQ